MFSRALSDRVETLINDLIEEGGLDSSSLASILVAAQESVNHGYCLELSRQVWLASNALRMHDQDMTDPTTPASPLRGLTRNLSQPSL